jgi:hypothetical protein
VPLRPRTAPAGAAGGSAESEQPPSLAFVVAAYALVVLLAVLLTLWGAFLVPFRVGGVLVPVSWLLAAVGNAALALAGGRLLGRIGAAVPGLLWLALVAALQTRRPEGDLILPGTPVGLGYLLVGALAAVVSYGYLSAPASAPDASPPPRARR